MWNHLQKKDLNGVSCVFDQQKLINKGSLSLPPKPNCPCVNGLRKKLPTGVAEDQMQAEGRLIRTP